LRALTRPEGKHVLIFGAGGAARAIAVELALAGARLIRITNRHPGRGEELARLLEDKTEANAEFLPWEGALQVPESTEIVVNATSVGFYPQTEAMVHVAPDSLKKSMIVADVIPNPPRTAFLRRAEAKGCHTMDGLGMLVFQAVAAIEHWTGKTVEAAVMRRKLEDIFQVR
jgi:shikimate dehydrogenase